MGNSGIEPFGRNISIGRGASLRHRATWQNPEGIDSFAWVTAHEGKHERVLSNFWRSGYVPAQDTDRDGIPDSRENPNIMPNTVLYWGRDSMGNPVRAYDVSPSPTYPDTIGYNTSGWNDQEDIVMRDPTNYMQIDQLWNNGDADHEDWSYDAARPADRPANAQFNGTTFHKQWK